MDASIRHSEHPYYCTDGYYFARGEQCHREWASWSDFIEAFGDADIDMNLVWRWDWNKPDEDDPRPETLDLFMMHQRKALPFSHSIRVEPEDEPAVRAYLEKHWATLNEMWKEVK
ncbi:hypothetical protein H8E07_13360 [bacterium]|nr:hypothetical protein [bacterium]